MVVFPNCKINIGLDILEKRADGFHNLETVFYPVPWMDILEIIPSEKEEFIFEGNAIDCPLNDNLCYKAYQLLKNDFSIPAITLFLYKNIPSGAGLGGGSADAAFTLTTLNQLFSLKIDDEKLQQYVSKLGSDCAFFIKNKPVFASGKGNIFSETDLNLQGYYLLIVKPQIHVSTADAYQMITPEFPKIYLKEAIKKPISEWKSCIKNDFESPVFTRHPKLEIIKNKIYSLGAKYATMSGSGSAIYGLFENKIDFKKEFPSEISWMKQL